MAYKKGIKRAASTAAGGARKKRAAPVAKKCKEIGQSIRNADSLPFPVRKLISDRLIHVFGTYKEDRHPFQVTVSDLVGNTLKATQGTLEARISEAQTAHADANGTFKGLSADSVAAHNVAEAAHQAMVGSKTALTDSHKALKDAKSALHNLEAAAKTAESDTLATTAKKEKLEALIKDFFTAVKEGTLNKGLRLSAAHAGKFLAKNFKGLEREYLVCVVRTFSKPASSWRSFDHIVDKELEGLLSNLVAGLVAELEGLAAAKAASVTNIENATGAVAAASEKQKAAVEAYKNASNQAKEANTAAKAAAGAAKQQSHHVEKAAASVSKAEHDLAAFKEGPLEAYNVAEAHTAPPPPPAVEEPAAVDAAMAPAPAPAARSQPTVLPSPGVLSWVAQKSGLARSPQVGESPRAA